MHSQTLTPPGSPQFTPLTPTSGYQSYLTAKENSIQDKLHIWKSGKMLSQLDELKIQQIPTPRHRIWHELTLPLWCAARKQPSNSQECRHVNVVILFWIVTHCPSSDSANCTSMRLLKTISTCWYFLKKASLLFPLHSQSQIAFFFLFNLRN